MLNQASKPTTSTLRKRNKGISANVLGLKVLVSEFRG